MLSKTTRLLEVNLVNRNKEGGGSHVQAGLELTIYQE